MPSAGSGIPSHVTKNIIKSESGDGPVRLQRALASAGYGSRRQCELLIVEGRIIVDGQTVSELGVSVDLSSQKVFVDGTPLKPRRLVYYALNKPVGVVTTNVDPEGRPRVIDLVPPDERVFPVGRLDRSSEGLILLTNDGDLAQRLAHPKFEIRKVYRVTVAGKIEAETLRQMERGIYIAEGMVRVEGAKILKTRGRATELEITLKEGKNREIRRILARLGHKVQQLKRIAIGPLRLGEMPSGAYRKLGFEEIKKLKAVASPKAKQDAAAESGDDPAPRRTKTGVKKSYKKRERAGAGPRTTKSAAPGKRSATGTSVGTKSRRPPAKPRAAIDLPTESKRTGAVIGADLPVKAKRVTKTIRDEENRLIAPRKKKSAPRKKGKGR